MYRIYCDDEIIYDPRLPEYMILDGQLKVGLNQSGSLTFTLPRINPSYGRIQLMKSNITLYDDDRLLFFGRAFAPSVDLFQQDTIECEGLMSFFNDTIQAPFDFSSGKVEDLLRQVLQTHNQQTTPERTVHLGRVTVTNSTKLGHITRASMHYMNTYEFLKEKFLDKLGGYFYFRFENKQIYMDYLADMDLVGNQEITQAINVLDAKREVSSHELATAILALGAKKEDSDTERIMIPQTESQYPLVVDERGVQQYGLIVKVVTHDNITDSRHLLNVAKQDLADSLGVLTKVTITASDLSKAGVSVTPFLLGHYLPVNIPNLNIQERMLVRELSIDLLAPEQSVLTIGVEKQTFTAQQLSTKVTIERVNQELSQRIEDKTTHAVVRAVREANSNLQQSADDIRSEVSEKYYNKEKADELLQAVRTLVTQTANSIQFDFNTYKTQQGKLYSDNANRFTQLNRYIRFENGHIILGEEGNPIILRIENDRIVFLERGVESAYWRNRKFYAVDGEFINSLKLGKFAFIPRQTGNLSFTKVEN